MWKAYLGLLLLVIAGSYITVHIQQDKNRKIENRQLKGQVEVLTIDNVSRQQEIERLNGRIKQANDRLLAQIEADRIKLEQANQEATTVRQANDRISQELAAARATIRDSQNPALVTWKAVPVPADAITGLRESATD